MSANTASIFAAVQDDTVFIRLVGRANFASAVDFKGLMDEMIQQGYRRFALDLKECPLMDSTFIGLLTGFGINLPPSDDPQAPSGISLHHANERVAGLLENLGVHHLFMSCADVHPRAGTVEEELPHAQAPSHLDIQRTCLKAHEILMEVNPDNVPKFKDVTRFLKEDLKKSQEPPA